MEKPTEEQAYTILEELRINYQRVDHEAIYSVRSYNADLPGPQVKNLLLKTKKGKEYYLVILPDEKAADLKLIATQLDSGRLSFASEEELDALMGVPAGSVTPFALTFDKQKRIQVVIDESVDHDDTVGFHPNINTTTLMIAFQDFIKVLEKVEHKPIYVQI